MQYRHRHVGEWYSVLSLSTAGGEGGGGGGGGGGGEGDRQDIVWCALIETL